MQKTSTQNSNISIISYFKDKLSYVIWTAIIIIITGLCIFTLYKEIVENEKINEIFVIFSFIIVGICIIYLLITIIVCLLFRKKDNQIINAFKPKDKAWKNMSKNQRDQYSLYDYSLWRRDYFICEDGMIWVKIYTICSTIIGYYLYSLVKKQKSNSFRNFIAITVFMFPSFLIVAAIITYAFTLILHIILQTNNSQQVLRKKNIYKKRSK